MTDSNVREEFRRISLGVPTTDCEVPTLREHKAEIEHGIAESVEHTLIGEGRKEHQVAPIHLIPPEILLQIWEYNCVEYSFIVIGRRGRLFPLVASWVSRYWRNLATNTSALWCSIVLHPALSPEFLKVQLERSGTHLLRVVIDPKSTRSATKLLQLLDTVMAHIDRWHLLSLFVTQREADFLQRPLRDVRAPQLKHLILHFNQNEVSLGPILTGGTPILSAVSLRGTDMHANLAPLTGLTSLSLTRTLHITHAELREVIHSSPCLNHLALHGRCVLYRSTDASDYPSIHAPFLRSLSISGVDELFVSNFFLVLSAPELQTLELAHILPDPLKKLLAVTNITTISYPHLSKLILNGVTASHPQATQLLQCFPSIDYLEIKCLEAYGYLSALVSSDEVLCPRLRTFVFVWTDHRGNGLETIRDLVSRRISMGLPIVRLHMRGNQFRYLLRSAQAYLYAHVHVELLNW